MQFKNKIIYEIFLKSFKDSDNDGIGDFQGLIEKIPYLKSLGINAIWITPFYASPMIDSGYDVSDYKKINSIFGTIEELKKLIRLCNENNIDVIADFVLNHTSSQHKWFQKALSGNEYYQNFYFFFDKPKSKWINRYDGESWTYVPKINKYYLHLYDQSQPDLNWDNPIVRQKMYEALEFWLKLGIKGYKLDVIYLISKPTYNNWEPSGKLYCTNAVADGKFVHKYIHELTSKTRKKFPNSYSIGEMSFSSIAECVKYSNPKNKEIDIIMTGKITHKSIPKKNKKHCFDWNKIDFSFYIKNIKEWINSLQKGGGWMCNFTTNHDLPRSINSLGSLKYWEKSSKMLNMYLLSCWGNPLFLQGDEIGMLNPEYDNIKDFIDIKSIKFVDWAQKNNIKLEKAKQLISEYGRDPGRNPMIWDKTKNGGFSAGNKTWRKIPKWLIEKSNVIEQETNSNSILNHFRQMTKLRLNNNVLLNGDIKFTNYDDFVLSFKRNVKNEKEIECLFNFSSKTKNIDKDFSSYKLLFSNYKKPSLHKLKLRPWEGLILESY